jgi:hypothetical protein
MHGQKVPVYYYKPSRNIHLVTQSLLSLQPCLMYCTMYIVLVLWYIVYVLSHQNNSGVKTQGTAPAKLQGFKHLL